MSQPSIIRVKIDVTKIDKSALYKGAKGTYLDIALLPSNNSQYGDDYMVTQDIGKERRQAGEKGPILGNGKIVHSQASAAPQQRQARAQSTWDEAPAPVKPATPDDGGEALPF